MGWDCVCMELRPLNGPNVKRSDDAHAAQVQLYWEEKTEGTGLKAVPELLCPQQIPHGLSYERTRASEVKIRGQPSMLWHSLINSYVYDLYTPNNIIHSFIMLIISSC